MPKRIAEAPELAVGLEFYFKAFIELKDFRSTLDAPIMLSEIMAYTQGYDWVPGELEDFVWVIHNLDIFYIGKRNELSK